MDTVFTQILAEVRQRVVRRGVRPSLSSADSRRLVKDANTCVRVLVSSWEACGFRVRIRNNSAMKLLASVWLKVYQTPHQGLTDLKSSFHLARAQSLTGLNMGSMTKGKIYPRSFTMNRRQLFQLSCGSRALPRPSQVVEERAIHAFKEMVLQPFPLEERDYRVIAEFLSHPYNRKIVQKFKKKYQGITDAGILSGSSTLGFSRREGGRSAATAKAVVWQGGRPALLKSTYNSTKWNRTKAKSYFNRTKPVDVSQSEVLVVPERGYKARIVTKNDPRRIAEAHGVRKRLFPLVTSCDTTVLADLPKVIDVKNASLDLWVYSVDLKSATDTLNHLFLDQLAEALDISPKLLHKGFSVDGQTVVRGAFMGMPVTWTILEWAHQYVCWTVDKSGSFRHKGDDLIAVWTPSQWREYRWRMKAFGFIINDLKTFISRDRGTFCEGHYILRGNKLVLEPTISIRSLVVLDGSDRTEVLSSASRESYRRGYPPARFNRIAVLFFPDLFKEAKKRNLLLWMPRELGGLGLVPDDPDRLLSIYESGYFWGGLEKDLPGLPLSTVTSRGPMLKAVLKELRVLKFRNSPDECDWFDFFMQQIFARASLHDANHVKECKKISRTVETLKSLSRIKRAIRVVERPARTHWSFTLTVKLRPTRNSVHSVLQHDYTSCPRPVRDTQRKDGESTI